MGPFSGVLEQLIFKIFWPIRPNRDTKLSLNPQCGPFNVKMLPPPLLKNLRFNKYMEITAKFKTAIKPQSLFPTERTTYFHSLRVYLQVIQWKMLMTTNADPLEWGWKVHQNFFAPMRTNLEPATTKLLNFVCCNCKTTS